MSAHTVTRAQRAALLRSEQLCESCLQRPWDYIEQLQTRGKRIVHSKLLCHICAVAAGYWKESEHD